MAGCDSHTSHVDKKCINTAGALIIELRRLYNHRITQSQQTQTNQHRDPKRKPKRQKEMPSRAWIWLASYLRKRRCTGPRSQNTPSPSWMSAPPEKKNTATLANGHEPSDVSNTSGSVWWEVRLGVFGERVSVLSIRDRSRIFSIG